MRSRFIIYPYTRFSHSPLPPTYEKRWIIPSFFIYPRIDSNRRWESALQVPKAHENCLQAHLQPGRPSPATQAIKQKERPKGRFLISFCSSLVGAMYRKARHNAPNILQSSPNALSLHFTTWEGSRSIYLHYFWFTKTVIKSTMLEKTSLRPHGVHLNLSTTKLTYSNQMQKLKKNTWK